MVVLQYSHVLQTQTGFISQLSTAYRVTLVYHVTLSLHGLEAATVNSFLDSVTSLLFTEGRRGCKGEGGRDKMKERDIERDTERNSERERMREREGWNETEEGEREVGEGDRERERYRDRQ